MLRAMVFIDQMNFQGALSSYYNGLNLQNPRIDYNKLPHFICSQITNSVLVKTFLCAPKPDDFLMQDPSLASYYKWLAGLRNQRNFDVIEGEYVARPTVEGRDIDINDRTTYYKREKGTDINIAVESITKAFNNAYDVGVFLSGDTDYLPIYRTLRTIGKLVVVAVVDGQSLGKIIPCVDQFVRLTQPDFDSMLRL